MSSSRISRKRPMTIPQPPSPVLHITLPMPPTTNTAYKNIFMRNGGMARAKTAKAKAWAFGATQSLVQQGLIGQPKTIVPPYKVTLALFFGDLRRSDIANREKLGVDLLVEHGIIEDDCNIDEMIIRRMPMDRKQPRVEITIETLG